MSNQLKPGDICEYISDGSIYILQRPCQGEPTRWIVEVVVECNQEWVGDNWFPVFDDKLRKLTHVE